MSAWAWTTRGSIPPVSRTIESAQSRVEGFNFDIRKRVVEFDDVINKQRETIYAERDKVLHNEDLTETVRCSWTPRSKP
jgi:preprotein translocase subunit SecA